jgi:hypothetical protein
MKLNCRLITDNSSYNFIPHSVFDKDINEEIWMEVNFGKYPPIEFKNILTPSNYLGIDGQYIKMEVNEHTVNLRVTNIISIGKYNLYVNEII